MIEPEIPVSANLQNDATPPYLHIPGRTIFIGTGFEADVKICQVTQVKLIRGSRSLLKKTCPVSGNLPFLFVIEGGTNGKSNFPSALATKEGGLGFAIGAIEHRSMHIMHYIIRDTLNVHSKYM